MAEPQPRNPSDRQPTKADMEAPIVADTTLDELGKTMMSGGAKPRPETKRPQPS